MKVNMADKIKLKLPDGKFIEFDRGITVAGVAESIGPRLARAAVAALVDGRLVDLATILDRDSAFEIVTFDSRAGREVFWHSSAHVII